MQDFDRIAVFSCLSTLLYYLADELLIPTVVATSLSPANAPVGSAGTVTVTTSRSRSRREDMSISSFSWFSNSIPALVSTKYTALAAADDRGNSSDWDNTFVVVVAVAVAVAVK